MHGILLRADYKLVTFLKFNKMWQFKLVLGCVQKTMSLQSELVLASDTPDVVSIDAQNSTMSDLSNNCCSHELPVVEQSGGEPMQCQSSVLPGLKEETPPGRGEIPDDAITEKSEVASGDAADANSEQVLQQSVVISPQLTATEVSEQLAMLHNTVQSLAASNAELRQMVNDGMTKVTELETAYAKSMARNNELEQELAQLRGSTEHIISDVALLATSVAQISIRVDTAAEVKPTPAAGDGSAEASAEKDTLSQLPTTEQRVGELELKLQQSMTRFGEFASALDSIERDLQRYIRRHSLVVENLSPKEDRSASEAFLIFVNSVLGVTVDDSDVDGYHLLDRTHEDNAAATNTQSPDKKNDLRPRPLLITFTCYRTRTRVYKVIFSTHGNSISIFLDRLRLLIFLKD